MKKEYLISVDLEGIHGIVGEAYDGLHTGVKDYDKAIENATKEINAVVKGLYDGGADRVAVWDSHWKGQNLDFSKIDSRVVRVENQPGVRYERLSFAKDFSFCGMLFVGYHAREGSLNGVLAHSYTSVGIQYYKVNGRAVGEIEIDAWVAAEHGIPSLFCSSDDVCISQALAVEPQMRTVVTKYGKGRNEAVYRDEETVISEMYEQAVACTRLNIQPKKLSFPAILEVRYTRTEDAKKRLEMVSKFGLRAEYGEDAHIIVSTLESIVDLESFI